MFPKHWIKTTFVAAVMLWTAAISPTAAPLPAAGNAVLDWNQIAFTSTISTTPAQGPIPQVRSMAIVHTAIHDAVNGITGEYETYLPMGPAPSGATAVAAAIGAAHQALTLLFPAQASTLDALRTSSLTFYGVTGDPGIGYGQSAAAAIVARAAADGFSQAQFPYTAPGAGNPGVWVPLSSAPALLPGYGKVKPWVLESGSQFRPDPPPPLTSRRYARDYIEVKEMGALNSVRRSSEQTEIARFWLATPTAIWNNPARQILEARSTDLSDTARVLALMYIASSDAAIACWDAKYTYNFWRPQTAIRNGASDGNIFTVSDTSWQSLFSPPPHPEYTSGHSTNSSSMATILALVFGDEPGIVIVATSNTNPGFERHWNTFSDGVEEVIDARIYGGFHYRTSDEVGAKLGRQVAQFVFTHAFRKNTGKD